jgi:hypothetical protein
MRELIRSAIAPLSDWRLLLLHFAGNALLAAAATAWLWIPEARVWQLLATVIIGLAILMAFAALHGGTLAHGVTPTREVLGADFRKSLRHLPAFVFFAVVLGFLMLWTSNYADQSSWQISGYFFTRLPHFLQRAFGEIRFHQWVEIKFTVLTWFLLPAIFLPFLSVSAYSGFEWSGLRSAWRAYAKWKYWLAMVTAAVAGILLPHLLANWTPVHRLHKEMVSMVLRLLIAYALAITVWLMTSAALGSILRPYLVLSVGENSGGNPSA